MKMQSSSLLFYFINFSFCHIFYTYIYHVTQLLAFESIVRCYIILYCTALNASINFINSWPFFSFVFFLSWPLPVQYTRKCVTLFCPLHLFCLYNSHSFIQLILKFYHVMLLLLYLYMYDKMKSYVCVIIWDFFAVVICESQQTFSFHTLSLLY